MKNSSVNVVKLRYYILSLSSVLCFLDSPMIIEALLWLPALENNAKLILILRIFCVINLPLNMNTSMKKYKSN